jgi:hypothetical protein
MNESSDQTLIPFGLRGDRMVAVRDVPSGLACGCICPACRSPLVARKGAQRRHHFAHAVSNPNCKYGPETAIHRMAKQCLLDAQRIMLPAYTWTATASDELGVVHSESAEICPSARISFERTIVEQQFAKLRPDVIGWADGQPSLVEIAVGHPVSGRKLERLRAAGVACIEIDLSREDRESLTEEKIHELVVESVSLKRWLSHPDLERIRSSLEEHAQTKARQADQNRRAARSTWTLQPTRGASTRPRRPEPSPVSADRKEPDRRILICESCRAIHDLGPYRESLTIAKFDCTHCGEPVSLADDPFRQHRL